MLGVKITSMLHCKKDSDIPAPRRNVTYQTLPEREEFYYSRLGRVW